MTSTYVVIYVNITYVVYSHIVVSINCFLYLSKITMAFKTEKDQTVPVISVRLVSADYYMSSPIPGLDFGYSRYRGLEIKKVPVIRIFGSTSTGL